MSEHDRAMFMPASSSTVPAGLVGEIGVTAEWVPHSDPDVPPGYFEHPVLGQEFSVHGSDLRFYVNPIPHPVANRPADEPEPYVLDPYTVQGQVTEVIVPLPEPGPEP